MPRQSEQTLEDNLIKQLEGLGHSRVKIKDEEQLISNLKSQLEKHNQHTYTDNEFDQILNQLDKGSVFDKAHTLRTKLHIKRDDGTDEYVELINQQDWCQNQFQVTNQITIQGTYENRYDVTLLINGLPLVQIELKRRGLELKEAFNQTNRYQRHSFSASRGLFQYIQLFIISNGVNTKYYANNKKQSFKQTFFWANEKNKNITKLEKFSEVFLEPCHLSKMITKYIVLAETDRVLMILRPYQYYATEAIVERVKHSAKNGYIWHTTGSGKTLTSFKTSQILTSIPEVDKVVFVVDRKDLDYQTITEFNSYSDGSIDGTDNTSTLVKQLAGNTKLIVTTIQKLNNAIVKNRYSSKLEELKDKKVVFIFDECHRSQFGETHQRIKEWFTNHQMFGFTGTPILAENSLNNKTTKDLFADCLHQYVITDAIKDENVLKFSVEYIGKYKQKEGSRTNLDIKVEDIDTAELLESSERLNKITDYIIDNHNRKTHSRDFNSIFCVSSVDALTKYYDLFKAKKEEGKHNLKIATIFSYSANEDDKDATGILDSDVLDMTDEDASINLHSRDKLESYIQDYNGLFKTNYTTKDSKSFYRYYNNISKRVKRREVDILLVVNMFLTGFDSKTLNTLYVDKSLRYHGLIQAFSRTNRTLNEQKSQGNIVCFRNLKTATDEAIALFSNKDAKEVILMEPYEEYVRKFNEAFAKLLGVAPTVGSVDELQDEEAQMRFVTAFREMLRLRNVLTSFADFTFEDLATTEQVFEDYKSKYLDIHDKVRLDNEHERVSILEDVDFELELIHKDEINVTYILNLLSDLVDATDEEKEQKKKVILDAVSGEAYLRSKRELIEKFIKENIPDIENSSEVSDSFDAFMTKERLEAFNKLCEEEDLETSKLEEVIENYLFTGKEPLRDDVVGTLKEKPDLLDRQTIVKRLSQKIKNFVDTFIEGV